MIRKPREHLFHREQRVVHDQFGSGIIKACLTRLNHNKTRMFKDTYVVLFVKYGSQTVREKDLKKEEYGPNVQKRLNKKILRRG
jgi:hypothetical protein